MPAVHAVAFLELHIDPFRAATFRPMIEVVQGMFEIIARPYFVGGAATPFHPIFEGHVRGVLNALGFLQRSANDAATAAGDRGRAAALGRLLQDDCFAARTSNFY